MSAPMDVMFAQRFFAVAGLYPDDKIDGRWGPKSQAASDAFDKFYNEQIVQFGRFDPRTETAIHTLLPSAQIAARKFMVITHQMPTGFVVKIGSGTRTCAEQNALFAQGRSTPGRKVTNAPCGHSNHNFGVAWDADIFFNGEYYDGADRSPARAALEEQAYVDLAKLVKASLPNIEWGGDWKTITDRPHYQLKTTTGGDMSKLQALFNAGKPYVV